MRACARHFLLLGTLCATASPLVADEIRLKDGKKLYGVIVGYEDKMFRVKTDYGFVLVEKDKIASIVPNAGTAGTGKSPKNSEGQPAPMAPAREGEGGAPEVAAGKAKISPAPVRPSLPAPTNANNLTPPTIKPGAAPPNSIAFANQPPVPQADPELAPNKEEVQGNLYTNFSHGFRMYKAPSWELIEDARKALPNALVAMGTANESTLMVVGQEKAKDSLEASASGVERRVREIYSNYRPLSQRKTVVGGSPAVEYKYRGTADDHDWSGTLVIIGRGKEVLTMLGMTYADSDLIQIQENVIARAISSMDFNVPKFSAEK
jgi:hypothetical protein